MNHIVKWSIGKLLNRVFFKGHPRGVKSVENF